MSPYSGNSAAKTHIGSGKPVAALLSVGHSLRTEQDSEQFLSLRPHLQTKGEYGKPEGQGHDRLTAAQAAASDAADPWVSFHGRAIAEDMPLVEQSLFHKVG